MSKTEFVQLRLTADDRERLERVAKAHYLPPSTWVRQVTLQAIEKWEGKAAGKRPTQKRPSKD